MENQGLQENLQGLQASWEANALRAAFVVAKDGSGNYKTISEAVAALARRGRSRPNRVVIYVKSGVYAEHVEIGRNMKNVMLVGDRIDKTIVTGNRNVPDGGSTFGSATFGRHCHRYRSWKIVFFLVKNVGSFLKIFGFYEDII